MSEPDKWDRAYVYQQLTGMGHLLNRHTAEQLSQYEELVRLRAAVAELVPLVGELRAKLDELESRHVKLCEYLKKKGMTSGGDNNATTQQNHAAK